MLSTLRLRGFYSLWQNFPVLFCSGLRSFTLSTTPRSKLLGLGSFPFARRYLGNRCFFLFLPVLRCFSSPRFLLMSYVFAHGYLHITAGGFPHSDICGSQDMCSSPQLFAACHVLLRLPVPRHPPYALSNLTNQDLPVASGRIFSFTIVNLVKCLVFSVEIVVFTLIS